MLYRRSTAPIHGGTFIDVVITLLGIALVVVGLNDIFHTLLHPSGRGTLSHLISVAVWRVSRRLGHPLASIAGPFGMVAVIVTWALLQALGWALIYLPHVPGGFVYSPGVNPADYNNFAEALYISLVTLSTLGYGDVVPLNDWLRIVSPVEALTGFALLTAALSWFSSSTRHSPAGVHWPSGSACWPIPTTHRT